MRSDSAPDLERVAEYLRSVIVAFSANLLTNVVLLVGAVGNADPTSLRFIRLLGFLAALFTVFFLVRLMAAMSYRAPLRVLAAIALFIPIIGLLVIARITGRAARDLTNAGYEVGLLGAKR